MSMHARAYSASGGYSTLSAGGSAGTGTGTQRPRTRIAVMTSGGDAAGMNAAVRAVVKFAIYKGCEAYVVREGLSGLVQGNAHAEPSSTALISPLASPIVSAAPSPALAPRSPAFGPKPGGTDYIPGLSLGAGYRYPWDKPYSRHHRFVPTYGYGELLREGVGGAADTGLKGRHIIRVGWDDVRGWTEQGGTLIGTARCQEFRQLEGRRQAALNLIVHGIDCLAVVGGDGSLTGADMLRKEWPDHIAALLAEGKITQVQYDRFKHLRIVGLVGSIDNDLATTDMTIGCSTALARACESVDSISSTAASHSRAFVVEVMGRHCGWIALQCAIATGADYIFIPEQPPLCDNPDADGGEEGEHGWAHEMCRVLQKHREVGKRKTIVIIAEGAIDKNLNPIKSADVAQVLSEQLGLDTRVTTLGHTQRGGKPDANDRVLSTLQAVEAVKALLQATPDTPSYVIGTRESKIIRVPLNDAIRQTNAVAEAIADRRFDDALAARGDAFAEDLKAWRIISEITDAHRVDEENRIRVGIMHIGAPAGGMNAATRTMVRFLLARGHTPVLISNGFPGLLEDNVQEVDWLRVDNWGIRGGSELGTNRVLPSVDYGAVASKFQLHDLDGLMLIGGFESFHAVKLMDEARGQYPAFRIPLVAIPATLSNNVPLNDFTLGCDTALNALVDACDAIKQSARASRNRVFVVETQGGNCGYLAVLGGLATDAALTYIPEMGLPLAQLLKDVEWLKKRYGIDRPGKSEGRLVLRNEESSGVFTTDVLTSILRQEGHPYFDARSASLGHTLQGGTPSPLDRCRATRLALRSCQWLESKARPELALSEAWATPTLHTSVPEELEESDAGEDDIYQAQQVRQLSVSGYDASSAAIITFRGSAIKMTTAREMAQEADMKHRTGRTAWWYGVKRLVDIMGARASSLETR